MFGWHERPTKAECVATVNDEPVYEVGYQWHVTVHKDGSVTYRKKHSIRSDASTLLPNMRADGEELCIPITDFVDVILSRLDPADLARALWSNEDVREAFMDALAERFSQGGVNDADRRKFLVKVKEAVHSHALDSLREKMSSLEYDMSKRSFFYHEVNRVNDFLREQGYVHADGTPIRLRHEDADPDFKIGGKHWNEARDWWRGEVLKRFPGQDAA